MELKWLIDLLTLMEERNFSRAAERRFVSQPAFSRRIRALEDWLGCRIVDRSASPIRILPAARQCEPEVRALVNRIEELRGRFQAESADRRRLNFAAQHTLAVSAFPDLIGLINTSIEKISYRLRSANKSECTAMCLRGDVDCLLCYETAAQPTELPEDDFVRLRWRKDRLIPVVGGPLCYQLDARGLPKEPIPYLAYPEGSFLGQVVAQVAIHNLTEKHAVERVCESAFSSGVKEMVLGGMGLAWLPSSLIWRELQAGRMTNLSQHFRHCELDIVLYGSRRNTLATRILSGIRDTGSAHQVQG